MKFDILSALKELRKQISNEFDFIREANNMDTIGSYIMKAMPREIAIPKSIYKTKKLLVMTFIEGTNLSKLDELKKNNNNNIIPSILKQRIGMKLFDVLSQAWALQLFELKRFHADPHPGNISINKNGFIIGLLDWGQIKILSDTMVLNFSLMIESLNSKNRNSIVESFKRLGIEMENANDHDSISKIAMTMLDTIEIANYSMNPFSSDNALKLNAVVKMPPELYFVVRSIQLLRGICYAFNLKDYSLAKAWSPYAQKIIQNNQNSFNMNSNSNKVLVEK